MLFYHSSGKFDRSSQLNGTVIVYVQKSSTFAFELIREWFWNSHNLLVISFSVINYVVSMRRPRESGEVSFFLFKFGHGLQEYTWTHIQRNQAVCRNRQAGRLHPCLSAGWSGPVRDFHPHRGRRRIPFHTGRHKVQHPEYLQGICIGNVPVNQRRRPMEKSRQGAFRNILQLAYPAWNRKRQTEKSIHQCRGNRYCWYPSERTEESWGGVLIIHKGYEGSVAKVCVSINKWYLCADI